MEKPINENDLLKLKIEITKEQQEARTVQNVEIAKLVLDGSESRTTQQLMKQTMEVILEKLEKMEAMIKEWFAESKTTYATKEEHLTNKIEIETIRKQQESIKDWLLKASLWFIGAGIVSIVAFLIKETWKI